MTKRQIIVKRNHLVIPLTQGKVALADVEDLKLLQAYNWSVLYLPATEAWYAKTRLPGPACSSKYEFMHRLILPGVPRVDHKNGNGLDNRRHNLRPASPSQNAINTVRRKLPKSGFRGVREEPSGKFIASIRCNYRVYYLGTFQTALKASLAYEAKAQELFGEFVPELSRKS